MKPFLGPLPLRLHCKYENVILRRISSIYVYILYLNIQTCSFLLSYSLGMKIECCLLLMKEHYVMFLRYDQLTSLLTYGTDFLKKLA